MIRTLQCIYYTAVSRWIVRAMRGTIRSGEASQRDALAIHQRFYTALALHDLAHEVPLSEVAAKYGATKVRFSFAICTIIAQNFICSWLTNLYKFKMYFVSCYDASTNI